jgi:hypothetical protein
MKGYSMIILILGLAALISYWGITSDRMARSIREGQVPVELAPDMKVREIACAGSDKPGHLNTATSSQQDMNGKLIFFSPDVEP